MLDFVFNLMVILSDVFEPMLIQNHNNFRDFLGQDFVFLVFIVFYQVHLKEFCVLFHQTVDVGNIDKLLR